MLNFVTTQLQAFLVADAITLANPSNYRGRISNLDTTRPKTPTAVIDNISASTPRSYKPSSLPTPSHDKPDPLQRLRLRKQTTPQTNNSASSDSVSVTKRLRLRKHATHSGYHLSVEHRPTSYTNPVTSTYLTCYRHPFAVVTAAPFHRTSLPATPVSRYLDNQRIYPPPWPRSTNTCHIL